MAPEPDWKLHFHRTLTIAGGTKETDMYYVDRLGGKSRIVLLVPHESRENLPQLVVARLNNVGTTIMDVSKQELLEIYSMFHGPWRQDEKSGARYITFSEDEGRRIKHLIFKEAAEKASIEHQYGVLLEDYRKLQRRNSVVEQELLRTRGRYAREELAESTDTVADLLDDTVDDGEDLSQLSFEHHSQVLCQRTGCGEV